MPSIDEIIHTAATVSFNPKRNSEMDQINFEATKKLLQTAKELNIAKFGFISSVASIGKNKSGNKNTEDSIWEDGPLISFYGKTKYKSQQLVISSNSDTLSTYVINPGVILGPCNWNKSSGTIFKTAIGGLKFFTTGKTGFVDARDVASAIIKVMDAGKPAEKHIVVEDNYYFKDVFTKIAVASKRKPPTIRASEFMTGIGWKLNWMTSKVMGTEPVLAKESARASHNIEEYDNSKLKKELDFEYHSIDDMIQNTIRFLKNENYF